jgi:hypothetical protein
MVVIYRSPRPTLKKEGYSDKAREAILAVYPELEAELLALPTWSSAERKLEKQSAAHAKKKLQRDAATVARKQQRVANAAEHTREQRRSTGMKKVSINAEGIPATVRANARRIKEST